MSSTRPIGPQRNEPSFDALSEALDEAATAVQNLEPTARQQAEQLRHAVEALHGSGINAIVRKLRADPRGRELLFELADDPLVRLLFSMHHVIQPTPVTESLHALDKVRPYLRAHGGDVELIRIDGDTAFLRVNGTCNSRALTGVTLREVVKDALVGGVASIARVVMLAGEPPPTLIPLGPVRTRDGGWVTVGTTMELSRQQITALHLERADGAEADVVIISMDDQLIAYRDTCAHQGLPINVAQLDPATGTLTCPRHGFCYDARSGACLNAPGARLEQLPLRIDNGQVWIRIDR
ncbi:MULTISPECIES: NifU family protein [unclassified Frankia]|uniref:NifU family protein n=1 Tax=unclassified Frankia TaxID=2632575 RepID=UPI001EF722A1|nr:MULTISPECIES: NifU family protein [unclassified Frankia]